MTDRRGVSIVPRNSPSPRTGGEHDGGSPDGQIHGCPLWFRGRHGPQLREAHDRDLAIENDEGVHFERAWLDPEAGKVFCLATGPSKEAVIRIHERAGHPPAEVYELTVEVA